MAQITVIGPTVDAIAYDRTTFYQDDAGLRTWNAPQPVHTGVYSHVQVSADNLAGEEEVGIYAVSGTSAMVVTDVSGTVQKLTASIPFLDLAPGPTYKFSKTVTANDCGVYVNLGNG